MKKFFKINIREMWLFLKVRAGYGIITFILTVIAVDMIKFSYWKFTLLFLPIDFLLGYWLNKYVFQKKKR